MSSSAYEVMGRYMDAMQEAAVIAKAEGRKGRFWRTRRSRNHRALVTYQRELYERLRPTATA